MREVSVRKLQPGESGIYLDGTLSPGVRGSLHRRPSIGCGKKRVLKPGSHASRGRSRQHFEDGYVDGVAAPIGEQNRACRSLIAAMMLDAVHEFRYLYKDRGVPQAMRSYAGRWLLGDGVMPFGFCWCCAVLDMNVERVRAAMEQGFKKHVLVYDV